jgi:hypothetical protein
MADYIPYNDKKFDGWVKFLIQYVDGKCGGNKPEWTHIPSEPRSALSDAYTVWEEAFNRTIGPHTSVDTAAKNTAKKALVALVRPFVNQYLRFPPVTDEDRQAMGIPNRDTHLTPVKVPDTVPSFSITQMGPGTLGIVYRNGDKARKGSKPKGVAGARIHYGVFDEPVTDQEKLSASKWATKCPYKLRFRETDRGKRAYFALRWEIRKENGESDWSGIQSEIIP